MAIDNDHFILVQDLLFDLEDYEVTLGYAADNYRADGDTDIADRAESDSMLAAELVGYLIGYLEETDSDGLDRCLVETYRLNLVQVRDTYPMRFFTKAGRYHRAADLAFLASEVSNSIAWLV